MKYIEKSGAELREQFGSHFNIGFSSFIRMDNLTRLTENFNHDILAKALSENLIFQYINYFPKCVYDIHETLGAKPEDVKTIENPHDAAFEEILVRNKILNSSYNNPEECKKELFDMSNNFIKTIKEKCNDFIKQKQFSEIFGLESKEKKEVKRFLSHLENELNMNNIIVDYTTVRNLPESFPKINDDFFVVGSTIQNLSIDKLKVSDIQIYDISNKHSKEEMPYTIHLESQENEKKFSMSKEHFDRSDGIEFSVGMAGYTLFKNEEKAQEYLSKVLEQYSENIENVQEKIKNVRNKKISP